MKALMVQGTASGVGKSVLMAGLCRLLARNGVRVAPFKAQNMSNNAAVTADGGEIGRAQALQALACGLEPTVDMNPVLIKPEVDHRAQLIVRGKVAGRLYAKNFRHERKPLLDIVLESFERLKSQYDVVLVEGAGSPAEPNLREGDIANMGFAEAADVPVWLVGDIDRGGVFASLAGTLDVLAPCERDRVKALVINRFRGHRALLDDGLSWLETRTGKRVAGIIPYLPLDLPEEDAPYRHVVGNEIGVLNIAVIAYPRMSNHDDVDPLASEDGVRVRFVHTPEQLQPADWILLPGSKHVASDLAWLRERGFIPFLERHMRYGGRVLGICGGMQMLGSTIQDTGIEGEACEGLGWLPMSTRMEADKVVRQVDQLARWPEGLRVTGYEIHHGRSDDNAALFPFAAASDDYRVLGTYVHGLFGQGEFRAACLRKMGYDKGNGEDQVLHTLAALDVLADTLERELSPDLLMPFLAKRHRDGAMAGPRILLGSV